MNLRVNHPFVECSAFEAWKLTTFFTRLKDLSKFWSWDYWEQRTLKWNCCFSQLVEQKTKSARGHSLPTKASSLKSYFTTPKLKMSYEVLPINEKIIHSEYYLLYYVLFYFRLLRKRIEIIYLCLKIKICYDTNWTCSNEKGHLPILHDF